jgi:hypothetical protein
MRGLLLGVLAGWVPEHWIGDLEEEADGEGDWWLARHVLVAVFYGTRMRLVNANLLESSAAASLLLGLPLVAALVLRRHILTLVPFRESAAYSLAAVSGLFVLTALLALLLTWALGRRWMVAALGTGVTAGIVLLLEAPVVLSVAAFAGGLLAMIRRRGERA